MRRTLIIHAGLPKCGSTALQFILASNIARLREEGSVFYPLIPNAGMGHMPLCKAIITASKRGTPAPELARMRADFDASGAARMVLSSEGFVFRSRGFKPAGIGDAFDGLDVEMVLFTRRRDEWVRSFYKQSVKNKARGYSHTLDEFVEDPPAFAARLDGGFVADAAQRFAELLKATRVHVVSLDVERTGTPELFGRILGVPMGSFSGDAAVLDGRKAMTHAAGKPINVAFSDVDTIFLAATNSIDAHPKWQKALRLALSELDTTDVAPRLRLMSAAMSKHLLEGAAEDDRRLAGMSGTAAASFPPHADDPDAEYRQTLTPAEYDAIRERVLARLDPANRPPLAAAVRPSKMIA